ncbi:hypothetical protein EYF80_036165 [Liparis tanakae]|uniref:Uncharacterized protein n=1 Tax=Liparis tanakae TaxID=230148 RepID=A0A4Z2GK51_9TELE|nr:hypothetical protein EYF80_036165 [Liparis tanakae]
METCAGGERLTTGTDGNAETSRPATNQMPSLRFLAVQERFTGGLFSSGALGWRRKRRRRRRRAPPPQRSRPNATQTST